MNQFDSSSCETLFFFCRFRLNVALSIYECTVVGLSTDSDKNNKLIKNGGLVIFIGASNLSGLLIPQASGKFDLIFDPWG